MAIKLIDIIFALLIVGLAECIFVVLVNKKTGKYHLYATIEKIIDK